STSWSESKSSATHQASASLGMLASLEQSVKAPRFTSPCSSRRGPAPSSRRSRAPNGPTSRRSRSPSWSKSTSSMAAGGRGRRGRPAAGGRVAEEQLGAAPLLEQEELGPAAREQVERVVVAEVEGAHVLDRSRDDRLGRVAVLAVQRALDAARSGGEEVRVAV